MWGLPLPPALPAVSPQLHLPVVRVGDGDPAAHHEISEPLDTGAVRDRRRHRPGRRHRLRRTCLNPPSSSP